MSDVVVLVPSSKAKEPGGEAPAYRESPSIQDHPLGDFRRQVLEQLEAAAEELDERGMARLCGISSDEADDHRARLRSIATSPTMPAQQRYTGIVHRNASLGEVEDTSTKVAIFGGLLGIAWLEDLVPDYRLEVTGRIPDLGVLGTWWREALVEHLTEVTAGCLVYDMLPQEHARMWPKRQRGDAQVVEVRFRRPDGRAAASASTKVAKGRLLRTLLDTPGTGPEEFARTEIEGWRLSVVDGAVEAVQEG